MIHASAANPTDTRYSPRLCSLCFLGIDHSEAAHDAEVSFTRRVHLDVAREDAMDRGATVEEAQQIAETTVGRFDA
jgi:hypothetical protein